jgi:tRNA(fMet)-specific endonuclease VapC
MTPVMLGTSPCSAFMRGDSEVKLALQRAEEIHLNPDILGELPAGFTRGKQRRKNERELQASLGLPHVNVLYVDEDTAEIYAAILVSLWRDGTPIPSNDLWVAACAMHHGLRPLTIDAQYQRVTQVIVDCVEASPGGARHCVSSSPMRKGLVQRRGGT